MSSYLIWGYLLSFIVGVHPLYISVSSLHYNSSEEQLEITTKVFIDDMEEGLSNSFSREFHLGLQNEWVLADSLIGQYVKDKMRIQVNESPLSLDFLGKEVDGQVIWLYLQAPISSPIQKIHVHNELLMEVFDEQTNLINIKIGQTKKSLILNLKKREDVATF